MKRYRRSLVLFLTFVILFELLVILAGNYFRSEWGHWGDEWHFQNTIKKFGAEISLETLRHYEEMSTPLPFVVYALWGRIFGFDLFHLRILSLIVALITYIAFHRLLFITVRDETVIFFGAALLVAQPYMIGFSIFVYTDMMAILFLILSVIAHVRRRFILFAVALALALLSRQYIAFLALATGLFHIGEILTVKKHHSVKMLLACALSLVPCGLLFLFWGGPSPNSSLRARYLDQGFFFHPTILSLYICLLFVYLSPLAVIYFRRFYSSWRVWLLVLPVSAYYWFFPIGPSKPSVDVGIPTVGLFNRILLTVLPDARLVHGVFYLCFLLAIPILIWVAKDLVTRYRKDNFDTELFLSLAIIAFFVVMPFSYLGWEKYFMPVVPLVILRILMIAS
ncbi:MAG: hypothetical protein AB1483_03530 [Candidatus Zixiibacteriota bacterium]